MTRRRPDIAISWSKRERALLYHSDCKPTGGMLAGVFEMTKMQDHYGGRLERDDPRFDKTFAAELERRGYDLTTLRFSIRRKATP